MATTIWFSSSLLFTVTIPAACVLFAGTVMGLAAGIGAIADRMGR